jgi:hypothetical protein
VTIPATRIAQALGGELVDKGANMQIWQSDGDTALEHSVEWSTPITTETSGTPRFSGMRLISPPRAYLESVNGTGRSREVARNLRQAILSGETPGVI